MPNGPDFSTLAPVTDGSPPFERVPDFPSLKPIAAKVPDFKSLKPVAPKAAPLNLEEPTPPRDSMERAARDYYMPKPATSKSTTKTALPSFVREDQERQYEQEAIAAAKPGLVDTIAKKLTLTPQDVSDAMSEIQSRGITASAEATGMPHDLAAQAYKVAQAIETSPARPGAASKLTAGVINRINQQTAATVSNPVAAAAMLAGGPLGASVLGRAAPLVARALSLGFAAQAVSQVPKVANNLTDAIKSGDPYKIGGASADAMMTVLFGAAGAKYGLQGIAKDVPVLNDALTRTIKENYTPDQLREIYGRVNQGKGNPQEEDLVRFINQEAGSPGAAVRAGVSVATPQPRFSYDPLNRFLGVKAGDRTLTIAGEPSTTGEDYAAQERPKQTSRVGKYLGIPQGENLPAHIEEVRQEEGGPPSGGGGAELSPTQRGPVNAPELAPTKLTPHDLRPAIIVNGQPVTAASALVHRDIVDDAVKSNSPQAPDIVLAAAADKNHVFVDPNNNVLTRDQASTALGLKQPLHSEGLNRLKGPSPDWQVTVQAASGEVPGYVQIDKVEGGKNIWSASPETLAKKGFEIPDFSKLPQGKYSFAKALELSKQPVKESAEQEWNKLHPEISYKRALEIEGVTEYPRHDAALFNFDKLTPEEQRIVIKDQENELVRAKTETKRQFGLGRKSVANLKGTDFEGRGMDDHKAALKYERLVATRLERLRSQLKPEVETFESMIAAAKTPEEIDRARSIIESSKNLTRTMKDEYLTQLQKPVATEPHNPTDLGYSSDRAFERDYKANSLKDYKETRDEFLKRRHCSQTVPVKKIKALA